MKTCQEIFCNLFLGSLHRAKVDSSLLSKMSRLFFRRCGRNGARPGLQIAHTQALNRRKTDSTGDEWCQIATQHNIRGKRRHWFRNRTVNQVAHQAARMQFCPAEELRTQAMRRRRSTVQGKGERAGQTASRALVQSSADTVPPSRTCPFGQIACVQLYRPYRSFC